MLELKGHTVIGYAFNGKDCIEKLNNSIKPLKPDFILMDHRMPINNGLEATEVLLKLNSNLKIIFVSADVSIKDKALSIGAIEFLEKPFELHSFHKILEKVLNT